MPLPLTSCQDWWSFCGGRTGSLDISSWMEPIQLWFADAQKSLPTWPLRRRWWQHHWGAESVSTRKWRWLKAVRIWHKTENSSVFLHCEFIVIIHTSYIEKHLEHLTEASSVWMFPQRGNIFVVDYQLLDGLTANVVNGKQNYLTAPLILLHLNPNNQLLPIAIQVNISDLWALQKTTNISTPFHPTVQK